MAEDPYANPRQKVVIISDMRVRSTVRHWLAMRFPHIENHRNIWGGRGKRVFRVHFAPRPYGCRCVFEYARVSTGPGQPDRVRVCLFGYTIFSGLFGAR